MKGVVRALFVTPKKKETPVPVQSVNTAGSGFDGDYHANFANKRQILMVSAAVLNELELEPGAIFENVVVEGLDVMSLAEGRRLRMGEALLEVTIPCEPCIQMERVRHGLQAALQDRRGMFARVVSIGSVRVGDAVEVL
jgi:MOSC domain-containing protein YiiM